MALKKQIFAAAISHGLDPRVTASWNPNLPRTPRVLVPIQVDALVVRSSGGTWADCRMRDPDPDRQDTVDASTLLPDPFTELPGPRPRGVHLHWALPDGLAHGVSAEPSAESEEPDPVQFPAIPDRWLVVRLGGSVKTRRRIKTADALSRRAVTAWVIESEGREPRVTPLADWSEPGAAGTPADERLTALGHGDPSWSAYYDNVRNRLAFHDALSGVTGGPLAYLVCGWYGDPAGDILGDSITSLAGFEQRITELGWELPAGSYGSARHAYERVRSAALMGLNTVEAYAMPRVQEALRAGGLANFDASSSLEFEGVAQAAPIDSAGKPVGGYFNTVQSWWPKYTLFHGSVVGIGWPSPGIPVAPSGLLGGEVGGPPPASQIRVAIGNSLTDALATLVAASNGSPDEARALEAVMLGATDELDEDDAAARIDVRLHSATFGSLPGGYEYETVLQRELADPPRPRPLKPERGDPGIFEKIRPREAVRKAASGKPFAQDGRNAAVGAVTQKHPKLSGVRFKQGAGMSDLLMAPDHLDDLQFAPGADPKLRPVRVKRALPRFFVPPDPVILLQGLERSFKHGGDGRFSESGRLPCRVSDRVTRELAPLALRGRPGAGRFKGADILQRGLANGGLPPECDSLLEELAILDPGSATYAARATARGGKRLSSKQVTETARTYAVEQTLWWASRDPLRDLAPLAAKSGLSGDLPCPLAVSPPLRPWVPLHLDWEVEYLPHAVEYWQLGEVDFDAASGQLPAPGQAVAGQLLRGRALLTPGAAQIASAAVRQTLEQAQRSGGSVSLKPDSAEQYHSDIAESLLSEINRIRVGGSGGDIVDDLRSLADALGQMDVLGGALDRFHTRLRGGFVADGRAAPDESSTPTPFVPLRAGFLRVRRLRLVDGFGQPLDLLGSSAAQPVEMSRLARSEPMTVTGRDDLLELAPRFTAPTRLLMRFVNAGNDREEARAEISPLCGFLLPDHLDAELQFHATDGDGLGAVRFDQQSDGIVWEEAPGKPAATGAVPARAIANRHLAGIAQGLLDWGVADTTRDDPALETALAALLRLIDTALWTVDPFGHVGDEHLSLLVGHPIAVLRARLTLEVDEPIHPEQLAGYQVPVRIGALSQWQDGVLGYFVDDDYRKLHIPDRAVAGMARPLGPGRGFQQAATQTSNYYNRFASDIGVNAQEGASPVEHDFVDTRGHLLLRPGQTVHLTLLVEPHSEVHLTSGIAPRKALGTRREWVSHGLARIAPSFRFGPVLVDPKRIRMPVAAELGGSWSWCHRVDPTTWSEDEVINSTGNAELPQDPVDGQEGWLKLTPDEPVNGGGS